MEPATLRGERHSHPPPPRRAASQPLPACASADVPLPPCVYYLFTTHVVYKSYERTSWHGARTVGGCDDGVTAGRGLGRDRALDIARPPSRLTPDPTPQTPHTLHPHFLVNISTEIPS
ncbi:hypothetical protein ACJJTC_004340 [Scirpophaga incertulas]